MQAAKTKTSHFLRWIIWVLIVQFVLINVSAAIYAHKFTTFNDGIPPVRKERNIFQKTWKLFVGPDFYKDGVEPKPAFFVSEKNLKTDSGINISTWYHQYDSFTTNCVVFVHGLSANRSYLNHEAEMFRQWGFNILMLDLRAHGKSGGNETSYGKTEVEEIDLAMNYARSLGNKKILLYGISMGGTICLKAATDGLIKPAAVIADMPYASLQNHLKTRAVELGFPGQPFGALVTFWIGVQRGFNGFKAPNLDNLDEIACPVLIQWGSRDRYVREDEIETIKSAIPSTQLSFTQFPGSDHQSLLLSDPQLWNQSVQTFVQKL